MRRSFLSRSVAMIAIISAAARASGTLEEEAHFSGLEALVTSLAGPGYGCAYSVRESGKLIEEHAAGARGLKGGERLLATDRFDIGSVSKGITAATVYRLAQEGGLSLQDPVSGYVERLPAWGNHVTIADLVHMRSGVPEFIVDDEDGAGWSGDRLYGLGIRIDEPASAAQILDAIRRMDRLDFPPGAQYEYSNSNYLLLRAAAEKATGRAFASLLQETAEIYAGVDIKLSDFEKGRRVSQSDVEGHDLTEEGPVTFLSDWDVLGASSVWISVHDLASWGEGLMADEARFRALSKPGIARDPETAPEKGYAFGLMTMEAEGEPLVYHLGGTEGFSSGLFMLPEQNAVMAFSCNMSPDLLVAHGMATDASAALAEYQDLVFFGVWRNGFL